MKRNIFAVMMLAAATLMTVGCNKVEEEITPLPDSQPKLCRIYQTGSATLLRQNISTGAWDTVSSTDNPRTLIYEFYYTGNRLDSLRQTNGIVNFSYDGQGRLVHSESYDHLWRIDYFYDGEGNLSRTVDYHTERNGDTNSVETIEYTWVGGHLQQSESNVVTGTNTIQIIHAYTWNGDRLVATDRYSLYRDGSRDTMSYKYDITSVKNPLCGMVFLQRPSRIFSFTNEGFEGLSPYIMSRITGGQSGNDTINFEYTTLDDRITSIHQTYEQESSSGPISMRISTDAKFEFEYK